MDSSKWKRQRQETRTVDFVAIVKQEGLVWASPSHQQTHPCLIESSAILQWQWDGELFSITINGARVVANLKMPAFHIWDGIPIDAGDERRRTHTTHTTQIQR